MVEAIEEAVNQVKSSGRHPKLVKVRVRPYLLFRVSWLLRFCLFCYSISIPSSSSIFESSLTANFLFNCRHKGWMRVFEME